MSRHALGDLIAPTGVIVGLPSTDKHGVLTALASQVAGSTGISEAAITTVILERESLGSTGFGHGTAIPHGRLAELSRIVAVAARLDVPVDFAALDGLPVDLIVLMLAPVGAGADHLKALARISRALRDEAFCTRLRGAASAGAFYAVLAGDSSGLPH